MDDLEDFPTTPPGPSRRDRRRTRSRRRAVLTGAATLLLLAAAAGAWVTAGRPGLTPPMQGPEQPDAVADDPTMPVDTLPVDEMLEPTPAPDASPGDVLAVEPTDLPDGLTAHRRDDGTWLVLEVTTPEDLAEQADEAIAAAAAKVGSGADFDPQAMGELALALEQRDTMHLTATGTSLLVTYPSGDRVAAWVAIRDSSGQLSSTLTAEAGSAAAAEQAVRDLAASEGLDLGDRLVLNVS